MLWGKTPLLNERTVAFPQVPQNNLVCSSYMYNVYTCRYMEHTIQKGISRILLTVPLMVLLSGFVVEFGHISIKDQP